MAIHDSRFPNRVGVIDAGSNTVHMIVLGRDLQIVLEESRITLLGQGVFDSGARAPAAIERSRAAIEELSAIARDSAAETLVVVGTEALRRARDGAEFLDSLVGPDHVYLLSGEAEAAYSIEATRREGGAEPLILIDVGGGSTEIAWSDRTSTDSARVRGISLPLGSVRLTESHLPRHPIPEADLSALRRAIASEVDAAELAPAEAGARVVAVAGTATTLVALELVMQVYDAERVEGSRVAVDTLTTWLTRLAGMSVEERKSLPGLQAGRADVIVAGLLILDVVLRRLGVADFRVSGRGVRHGVALRLLEGLPVVW